MRAVGDDDGFTLIEMITVLSLASILMAVATWSFSSYNKSTAHSGTASQLQSAMRNVSERALSEGRTYCLYLNTTADSWSTYRGSCTVSTNRVAGPEKTGHNVVEIGPISFPPLATPIPNQITTCPAANACAYFYPRGTALGGSVVVTRRGSSKTYTVSVQELTSRVQIQ